jgi:ubiquinone/menaquinone biosynthesis C-methylase UbiE/uncharacterized protein YbaR (Trm112 family)
MEKLNLINAIKDIYAKGGNIIQYLKGNKNSGNTLEDILISYDFQAGSYIQEFYSNQSYIQQYTSGIAQVINKLGEFDSIAEAGVGEATTFAAVINKLSRKVKGFGFDLSWSRINYAYNFTRDLGLKDLTLFTGDLFEIPLADNSIDIVYTSHSIEPNGGKEREALEELFRVTNKYLVLFEPSFELGKEEARARMQKHGYVTKLRQTADELGYKIIEHRLFEVTNNSLNPTAVMIIEKNAAAQSLSPSLVCPVSKTTLLNDANVLYSRESLLAYPIVKNIPCLLRQNAVLATHFELVYDDFKKKL